MFKLLDPAGIKPLIEKAMGVQTFREDRADETEFMAEAFRTHGATEVFATDDPDEPAPARWAGGGRVVHPDIAVRVVARLRSRRSARAGAGEGPAELRSAPVGTTA